MWLFKNSTPQVTLRSTPTAPQMKKQGTFIQGNPAREVHAPEHRPRGGESRALPDLNPTRQLSPARETEATDTASQLLPNSPKTAILHGRATLLLIFLKNNPMKKSHRLCSGH